MEKERLKLSLSNGIFAHLPLAENIVAVQKLGFENLEFNMKSVEKENDDSVYVAEKLIKMHGLRCLTVHAACLHVKEENEISKAVYYGKVSADFAHQLSAPVLVVHSDINRRLPSDLRKKFLTRIFSELKSYAEKLRLKLALENLSYASTGYGKNVDELEEAISTIGNANLGVTLDFCHAEATGQTLRLLNKYYERLCNVHISNRAHTPFKEETSNLKAFLSKLKDYGYDGPLTVELNRKCSMEEIQQTKTVLQKLI
ncbi:MAG: sugar phosphate isomerase/epimerase [Candidatus Bathyarchaeota archaeon]|nr:sugar phosphate isomerase/epimerase [Candidatus Bathyarchaeota archaeon]